MSEFLILYILTVVVTNYLFHMQHIYLREVEMSKVPDMVKFAKECLGDPKAPLTMPYQWNKHTINVCYSVTAFALRNALRAYNPVVVRWNPNLKPYDYPTAKVTIIYEKF